MFDTIYPRRRDRLPPEALPFGWHVAEIVAALVVYDMLFFASHVVIHKVPWIYRRVHAKHHRRVIMRARETVALSIADEVLDVSCSIAALNLLKCHPLSRALYNVTIIFLLCDLHSGYDMPWMLQNVVPFGICSGSRRHTDHHKHGRAFYQKFFVYLDNFFGFNKLPEATKIE
ncbi:hypothetical protein CYMTET_12960 [Cymbomonas tetramitiformis]|uniref:Fatty acid hydroxylase domain-containing protein n=1 Tax=Cymbomonas tetramitiformis TaxID=36881 RepID=A0AAE0GJA2_9CHLO|nr:hypothetical protein CYMTET_12960 [Cymbomonas tetramitiformis]